jgi:hypothetical protein
VVAEKERQPQQLQRRRQQALTCGVCPDCGLQQHPLQRRQLLHLLPSDQQQRQVGHVHGSPLRLLLPPRQLCLLRHLILPFISWLLEPGLQVWGLRALGLGLGLGLHWGLPLLLLTRIRLCGLPGGLLLGLGLGLWTWLCGPPGLGPGLPLLLRTWLCGLLRLPLGLPCSLLW